MFAKALDLLGDPGDSQLNAAEKLSEVPLAPATQTAKAQSRVEVRPFEDNGGAIRTLSFKSFETAPEISVEPRLYFDAMLRKRQLQAGSQKCAEMERRKAAHQKNPQWSRFWRSAFLQDAQGFRESHCFGYIPASSGGTALVLDRGRSL